MRISKKNVDIGDRPRSPSLLRVTSAAWFRLTPPLLPPPDGLQVVGDQHRPGVSRKAHGFKLRVRNSVEQSRAPWESAIGLNISTPVRAAPASVGAASEAILISAKAGATSLRTPTSQMQAAAPATKRTIATRSAKQSARRLLECTFVFDPNYNAASQ